MKPSDAVVEEMRSAARAAMKNAYCRYSKFRVGAAVPAAEKEYWRIKRETSLQRSIINYGSESWGDAPGFD
jgi:cytidine deaminase